MRVELILANWTLFAEGIWMTLQLTAVALAVGFSIALPAGLARARRVPWRLAASSTATSISSAARRCWCRPS